MPTGTAPRKILNRRRKSVCLLATEKTRGTKKTDTQPKKKESNQLNSVVDTQTLASQIEAHCGKRPDGRTPTACKIIISRARRVRSMKNALFAAPNK